LITPSGVPPEELTTGQLAVTDLAGHPQEDGSRPSSELPLHLAVYAATAAAAVVHTHSLFATAVSITCEELPAVHYAIADLGGPVRVVPYRTFGTEELAEAVGAGIAGRTAAIIQNHGTVTFGGSVAEAYERAQALEWLAELYCRARHLGDPRILDEAELAAVNSQMERLGYRRHRN
jgi:L-fuculose-phosphate aldolase